MIDELIFGGIAVLAAVTLFTTRRYINRLEEVAEEIAALRKDLRKTRKSHRKAKNDDSTLRN